MVLYQRCVFQNFFLRGQKYAFQPARKTPTPQFAFTLPLGFRGVGHNTISEITGFGERTLIAVKPDGVQRRLVGIIMQRFEQRGFKLVGLKMLQAPEDLLSQHYRELRKKIFYPCLLRYMTSGPVVVMVWEGHNVVQTSRIMVGATNPAEAQAGTVRGDFSIHVSRNVVHASDSVEGAQREIQLWFNRTELMVGDRCENSSTYQA